MAKQNQQFKERAQALVAQMTREEKISQMMHRAPAIERLNLPEYNWWNECLHGVGRAGLATVFPQAIGLAATWNTPLMHRVATAISDEARAKHHEALRNGNHGQYFGLTMWSPNINIFRDPRWGRGQETYGEDPYLTARMGVAFITGLQGDDPDYLKVVATPKHYAVHSGPEHARHHFDVSPSRRDLWETYLPAFEACIIEADAASIMGAYNRVDGDPACASKPLLQDILRDKWGFDGFVVSDCGAIDDIYLHHKVVETAAEAAALAVIAGCDLECYRTYEALIDALDTKLIEEETIDRALIRLFTPRYQLGMFDDPDTVPYAQIPYSVVDCEEHRQLSFETAREAMALLKNDNLLPLTDKPQKIAVIGPNAHDPQVLLGNYNGTHSYTVTPFEGIQARASQSEVTYSQGCGVFTKDNRAFQEALHLPQESDLIIFVGGLNQALEGEEGQEEGLPEGLVSKGDRASIDLPESQDDLLKALHNTGKPIILVLINGSAIAINWADDHLPAILEAWYPGQDGGTAIADILFGDYNPAGRLPVTFYRSLDDLPSFDDYSMKNRTYRYFNGEVLYPFGYGLSYTCFEYSNFQADKNSLCLQDESINLTVDVSNTGDLPSDEVVQIYRISNCPDYPHRQLVAFERIHLAIGETKTVSFILSSEQFMMIDDNGEKHFQPGIFTVSAGGGQTEHTLTQQTTITTVINT